VTEYMHPRLQEICEVMPAKVGAFILGNATLRRWLEPLFKKGRHVEITSLRWFLALRLVASLRAIRPWTLRYREEQKRIEDWLSLVGRMAATDRDGAAELLACQQLIKGYSDTFERGLANFEAIMREAHGIVGKPGGGARLKALREAALADENGKALACVLSEGVAA